MILGIVTAICGCGWFATLIMFFVQRHDQKKEGLDTIKKQLKRLEKDGIRTQLLLLMRTYSDEDEYELLQVAEHYFSKDELAGDWYMTTLFNRFLQNHNIAKPSWFEE